ncbi:MAG TPA: isoprenylcysteine carboxylmethyltransferase family protein [Anaerolineales bacterium]|jgi:protein-S-isoprenylcysteine O-methyltransferase Ste14|nr:isoprenylcysteine carboxylmethyltransferase family protein [Anaerolineales bacterium]
MSQENIFRVLIFVFMLANFTVSAYFRRQADQNDGKTTFEEENPILLKLRSAGALLMYGSILAYLIYPASMQWAQLNLSPILRWLAIGVMAALVPLFYWLFSSLGNNITPTVSIRKEHTLVTSGPYRWIRHPLYTFGTIFILAIATAAANWFIFGIGLLTFIPLTMRTPLEEQRLLETFGDDYRDYIKRTGRYLPKLRL